VTWLRHRIFEILLFHSQVSDLSEEAQHRESH
jgi:hypothetical protein